MPAVLSVHQLNRTLLHRQHLLARSSATTGDMLCTLVGLQGQVTNDPYLALWSRIQGFRHNDLSAMLLQRSAVRASLMRGTIHVVTDDDYRLLMPLTLPLHIKGFPALASGKLVPPEIIPDVIEHGRDVLQNGPLTTAELGALLQQRWPEVDAHALGQVIRYHLPLIQPTPRGIWGASGAAKWALPNIWLNSPVAASSADVTPMVRRYLAAFGPASVADITAWSGIRGFKPVLQAMRDELVSYRNEQGTELLDLAELPVLRGDEPAPVRFLPGFDNALLGHKDRTRIISNEHRAIIAAANGLFASTFLVNGFVAGSWKISDGQMTLRAFGSLTMPQRREVEAEARLVAHFWSGAAADIMWTG